MFILVLLKLGVGKEQREVWRTRNNLSDYLVNTVDRAPAKKVLKPELKFTLRNLSKYYLVREINFMEA